MAKELIKGVYAIAQAAINAGLECYFGYPITPQSEIGEYMSDKMPKKGLAYVCDLSAEEIKNTRGTLVEAGQNSPYRDRSVEENLRLFEEMKNGVYGDGEKVLRAKIDMASPT